MVEWWSYEPQVTRSKLVSSTILFYVCCVIPLFFFIFENHNIKFTFFVHLTSISRRPMIQKTSRVPQKLSKRGFQVKQKIVRHRRSCSMYIPLSNPMTLDDLLSALVCHSVEKGSLCECFTCWYLNSYPK